MRAPSQRHALGALFLVLAFSFAAVAGAAADAREWVISLAATVLAVWLASMSMRLARRR